MEKTVRNGIPLLQHFITTRPHLSWLTHLWVGSGQCHTGTADSASSLASRVGLLPSILRIPYWLPRLRDWATEMITGWKVRTMKIISSQGRHKTKSFPFLTPGESCETQVRHSWVSRTVDQAISLWLPWENILILGAFYLSASFSCTLTHIPGVLLSVKVIVHKTSKDLHSG